VYTGRFGIVRAWGDEFRRRFVFHPGLERIDRINAPDMSGRAFTITADIEVPGGMEAPPQGVLLAFGTALAGWVMYLKNGHVVHEYVFSGRVKHVVRSAHPVGAGAHRLRYEFVRARGRPSIGRLLVDGVEAGHVEVPKTWPNRAVQGGLTCGRDSGLAVSDAYEAPFAFSAKLLQVVVELGDEVFSEPGAVVATWPPPLTR
jgi:hypothetical protein